MGTTLSLVLAVLTWMSERLVVHLFTSDLQVAAMCESMWPWLVVFITLDGLFCMQETLLRALGMQLQLGVITIISLWLVGFPGMYWVAIPQGLGFAGIWYAMTPIYILYNIAIAATCFLA